MMRLISAVILFSLLLTGCTSGPEEGGLPVVRLDKIEKEPIEVRLSELTDQHFVIPLEAQYRSFMNYADYLLTDEYIFAGKRNRSQRDPSVVLCFDWYGRYINTIGNIGRRLSGHMGHHVEAMRYYPEDTVLLISWNGASMDNPQLFKPDGTWVRDITRPYHAISSPERISDSIWFSPGIFAGRPRNSGDSISGMYYTSSGTVLAEIPRKRYPAGVGYTASPWSHTIYTFRDSLKMMMGGSDTLYLVGENRLTPLAIFYTGEKNGIPYNKVIDPQLLDNRFFVEILSETRDYWFLRKSTLDDVEVNEWRSGRWSTMVNNMTEELLRVDKVTGKVYRMRLVDDIFNVIPEHTLRTELRWQSDGRIYIPFQPTDFRLMLNEVPESTSGNAVRQLFAIGETLNQESNPILFVFTLKGSYPGMAAPDR